MPLCIIMISIMPGCLLLVSTEYLARGKKKNRSVSFVFPRTSSINALTSVCWKRDLPVSYYFYWCKHISWKFFCEILGSSGGEVAEIDSSELIWKHFRKTMSSNNPGVYSVNTCINIIDRNLYNWERDAKEKQFITL